MTNKKKNQDFCQKCCSMCANTYKKSIFLAILLFTIPYLAFAQTTGQNVKLNFTDTPLSVVINDIEKQSGFKFFYNNDIDVTQRMSVQITSNDMHQVVSTLLKDTSIGYSISGQRIVLFAKKATANGKKTYTVNGVVNDANGPVIGATVSTKDGKGTITSLDGDFRLENIRIGDVLTVSYIGYQAKSIVFNGQEKLVVDLVEDTKTLDEVVVTALGIKRATKALSYNVQQVKTDDVTVNKDVNFINALSGKVAGVNINASSSGVGGASKVVMRGTKSITQSSNALYVIDGVPMFPQTKTGGMEFDAKGTTEPIADINPEDIESMSVLTGAAAAALYGSAAANGAIVITTKKGKEGRVQITVNSTTEVMDAFVLPKFQNRYGTGSLNSQANVLDRSWGRALNSSNYYGYSPADDYLKTGVTATESISLSTGTDKNQTYLSAAAVNSNGIIPNNKYDRYNFTFRNTTKFLNDKMTLDLGAGYVYQRDRNMINQGEYGNPLVGAYLFPRGNDWEAARMYKRYDESRKIDTQYWPVGDGGLTMQNPYWVNYRNLRENSKDRYMINANLHYQILDWLSVSGRVRLDNSINDYTEKYYATTNDQLTEGSKRGFYGINRTKDKQIYADALLSINKSFSNDWNLQANLGTSFSDMRTDLLGIGGPIADGSIPGEKQGLTNFFAVQHLSPSKTARNQDGWREQSQSVFGSAEIGYKSTYYLTLTGRNDWPSQLAGPKSVNKSFFYPSVGLSVILSEIIPNMPADLPYIKMRGSYASVGSPFMRFIANPSYEWHQKLYSWSNNTVYPVYNLKPERTDSYELGLTVRFLKYFDLDATYYSATTKNQTFDPKIGGGAYSKIYIQTGSIRNRGVELSLNFHKTWNKFTWNSGYTFSTNKNKILVLADNAINPDTGKEFSISTLDMNGLGGARFLLKKGGTMGDLYSRVDLKRDSNGAIYITPDNKITTSPITEEKNYIKLGSVLPKANMAWRNNFNWNNFHFGFLISARLGGIVFSRTQAVLDNFGVSEASATARDKGYVIVNKGDYVNPETWYTTIGGGTSIPQYYTYSATNVRLQEASVGYTIPRKKLGNICDITCSLVGRNLWMIYNKAPFDPQNVATTGNFYDGIDYFMMPSLRSIGLSLNLKF